MTPDAATRLAVYGSLAPGEANHRRLIGLAGVWKKGAIRGRLEDRGWGARVGYPGLRLDLAAEPLPVQVFESPDLPKHWPALDLFEGGDYSRVVATVELEDGSIVEASVYTLAR